MEFKVTELVENPDGSADIQIEISPCLMKLVVQEGFVSIIKQALETYRESKLG